MLFTFEAFSLSLSYLGAIPDIKTLFVFVLQVIAELKIPIVISSGVCIVFKLFVPVFTDGGAFMSPLLKVISEKRDQAHIRGFLLLKAFFFGSEYKYFCAVKEAT